jgi:hypothetical protein
MFKIPFTRPNLDSLVGKVINLAVSSDNHIKGKVFKSGNNGTAHYEVLYSLNKTLGLIGAIPISDKGLKFIGMNTYTASKPPFRLPIIYFANHKTSAYGLGYDERKHFLED